MDNSATQPRSFPRPGTPYYGYIEDPNYKSKFLDSFKYTNKIILPLYPVLAPLFRLFKMKIYILTTKGRVSGLMRKTPLEYDKIDGILHGGVVNPKKSQWFRNILANPDDVWAQIGSHKFHARIEVLDDEGTIGVVKYYIRTHPSYSKFWGWDPNRDDLETADFSPMLKLYRFYRIHEY
ncbi:MAG: nitroreductase family deazaflavin-dependent oxidoreductase [Chloroflexi bacterium]|nr:nitroreductase family deazaflavin-dependent oxidoreductase [Chloroflexota bacterium]